MHAGLPSPPTLVVTAVDLETFSFTITPPVYGSQCVTTYTITPSVSGVIISDIVVQARDMETTIMRGGFDLQCDNIYSFTIVANTAASPGERSGMVTPDLVDSLSEKKLQLYIYTGKSHQPS